MTLSKTDVMARLPSGLLSFVSRGQSAVEQSMEPLRQAYKRRMELIDRVCDVCASGGLTSEALEQFAPESRLIESEIRLDKASSSQFDPAAQDRVTCRA